MGWLTFLWRAPTSAWAWFIGVTDAHPGSAAWVQAIFTIIALAAAVAVPALQRRWEIKRDDQRRRQRAEWLLTLLLPDFFLAAMGVLLRYDRFADGVPDCPLTCRKGEWLKEFAVELSPRFWDMNKEALDSDHKRLQPLYDFVRAVELHNGYLREHVYSAEAGSREQWQQTLNIIRNNLKIAIDTGRLAWPTLTEGGELPEIFRPRAWENE